MTGASDPDAATARWLRQRALDEIKFSILGYVITLRDNADKRKELLQQESVFLHDYAPQLQASLHREIDLLGQRPVPKEFEQLLRLLRGTEQLRGVMEQRRSEMETETARLGAYISDLYTAAYLITGYDARNDTGVGSGSA
ncbi:hypothetical protein VE03_08157 [Pseudogymnoascus sp. 23342-1-I1]|nr:hypothetical protein VE03_08157 [Pseudogymnoascus sp. 23342-1-I1]